MEKATWYMDESGNTGDIQLNGVDKMSYLDERYFILGSLKLNSIQLKVLDEKVSQLKENHKIKSKELKSKDLYRKKKKFLIDFFKLLKDIEIRAIAELIDKKYNLSIQIVDNTVRPNFNEKRVYAQWITENLDDKDYKFFLEASKTKTKKDFEIYIKNLLITLDNKSEEYLMKAMPSEDLKSPLIRMDYVINSFGDALKNNSKESMKGHFIANKIKERVEESFKKYKKNLKKKKRINPHNRYLPIEDTSKNDKIYSHLPHVNCFTNLFLRGVPLEEDISVEIVHDVQNEFGSILENNLKSAINHTGLRNKVKLEFKDSIECKGVQYSDLVAGTLHKVWRDYIVKNIEDEEIEALYEVLTDVVVINLVLPDSFTSSNKKLEKIVSTFFFKEGENMAKENLKRSLFNGKKKTK